VIPGDQVRFGVTGSQAVVTGDDGEALAAEETVRQIFATAAKSEIGMPAAAARGMAEKVEQRADHESLVGLSP
jgi:hypothetical protein